MVLRFFFWFSACFGKVHCVNKVITVKKLNMKSDFRERNPFRRHVCFNCVTSKHISEFKRRPEMDEWCRNLRLTSIISLLAIQRKRSLCYHRDLWKECSVLLRGWDGGTKYPVTPCSSLTACTVHTVHAHLNMQEGRRELEPKKTITRDDSSVI